MKFHKAPKIDVKLGISIATAYVTEARKSYLHSKITLKIVQLTNI